MDIIIRISLAQKNSVTVTWPILVFLRAVLPFAVRYLFFFSSTVMKQCKKSDSFPMNQFNREIFIRPRFSSTSYKCDTQRQIVDAHLNRQSTYNKQDWHLTTNRHTSSIVVVSVINRPERCSLNNAWVQLRSNQAVLDFHSGKRCSARSA